MHKNDIIIGCTFQSLINVVLIVIDTVNVIQVHVSSFRNAILSNINGRVSILLLDEVQNGSESSWGHFQPG